MKTLLHLPWKTRLATLVLYPLLLVVPPILERGTRPADTAVGPTSAMSPGWAIAAWMFAAPLVVVEVAASKSGHRWLARLGAALAVAVLATVASVPITVQFGAPRAIGVDWIGMSVNTYVVLVAGYLLGTLGACTVPSALRALASPPRV